jgi:energy-coupling factor transporter transmembrane protein EcfT
MSGFFIRFLSRMNIKCYKERMHINTSTQFILLFIFAVALNLWSLNAMLVSMFVLMLLLCYQHNKHYYALMRRLKWFYLVMFCIFVFNTPGEHIMNWPFSIKATYEGLEMGLMQVLRIALVLAVVSMILTLNTRQKLMSGLYFIMKPLSLIGLDIQRFSARLWLTLHYVELRQAETKVTVSPNNLIDNLNHIFTEEQNEELMIILEKPIFTWVDYGAVLVMLTVLLIAFLS